MATTFPHAINVTAGGVTVTAGGLTVTAGGLTVTAGGASVNGGLVYNESGADVDFRIETDNISNGFVVDAGLDVFAFGAAGADDQFVAVKPPVATHTADTDTYLFRATSGGAQTIPAGVTSLVATARFDEPNITATGTVTAAATVYIADAPTEGSANYALYVGTGGVEFTTLPTVGTAKMLTKHKMTVAFPDVVKNSTNSIGILPIRAAMTITGISIGFTTVPASVGGTVTLAIANYDCSGTPAADNLLSTATVDLETLSNTVPLDCTLTAVSADKTLADGDFVYATIISNNGDMTGGTGGCFIVEWVDA